VAAELFVDASAWYPLLVRSLAHHDAVKAALQGAVRHRARLVTTNLVVAETHSLLLRRTSRNTALAFASSMIDPQMLVVRSSADLERAAITDWLERYDDHDFSFADAVSFAVMAERGIGEALTLDRHFGAAGFRMVPG
jgi:predicted nucleic acid-binding protein